MVESGMALNRGGDVVDLYCWLYELCETAAVSGLRLPRENWRGKLFNLSFARAAFSAYEPLARRCCCAPGSYRQSPACINTGRIRRVRSARDYDFNGDFPDDRTAVFARAGSVYCQGRIHARDWGSCQHSHSRQRRPREGRDRSGSAYNVTELITTRALPSRRQTPKTCIGRCAPATISTTLLPGRKNAPCRGR